MNLRKGKKTVEDICIAENEWWLKYTKVIFPETFVLQFFSCEFEERRKCNFDLEMSALTAFYLIQQTYNIVWNQNFKTSQE